MGLSNNLTAVLNFIAFVCSIPIVASGIWLASQPDNECIHFFRWPIILLGLLILVVSLTGFLGAYWYKETLLAFYLCCMAILITLLLILVVFAFVVTRADGSYDVPGRGYKEFRIKGFSSWLRNHVVNSKNWGAIRNCLAETDVCSKLSQNYISAEQFFTAHISPLQGRATKLIVHFRNPSAIRMSLHYAKSNSEMDTKDTGPGGTQKFDRDQDFYLDQDYSRHELKPVFKVILGVENTEKTYRAIYTHSYLETHTETLILSKHDTTTLEFPCRFRT